MIVKYGFNKPSTLSSLENRLKFAGGDPSFSDPPNVLPRQSFRRVSSFFVEVILTELITLLYY